MPRFGYDRTNERSVALRQGERRAFCTGFFMNRGQTPAALSGLQHGEENRASGRGFLATALGTGSIDRTGAGLKGEHRYNDRGSHHRRSPYVGPLMSARNVHHKSGAFSVSTSKNSLATPSAAYSRVQIEE